MARTGEAVEELRRVERRRRFSAETLLLLAPLGAPVLEPNLEPNFNGKSITYLFG